jgi:hypothetical protein
MNEKTGRKKAHTSDPLQAPVSLTAYLYNKGQKP